MQLKQIFEYRVKILWDEMKIHKLYLHENTIANTVLTLCMY